MAWHQIAPSRYISTATPEEEIDLGAVHAELVSLEKNIAQATQKHNTSQEELGLPVLPLTGHLSPLGSSEV